MSNNRRPRDVLILMLRVRSDNHDRFSFMVRQSATVENNMNSVERIVHYAKEVEQEASYEDPKAKPKAPWPAKGHVELKDVSLKYRPELPLVLRGISMNIQPGEKIGIVGRSVYKF